MDYAPKDGTIILVKANHPMIGNRSILPAAYMVSEETPQAGEWLGAFPTHYGRPRFGKSSGLPEGWGTVILSPIAWRNLPR